MLPTFLHLKFNWWLINLRILLAFFSPRTLNNTWTILQSLRIFFQLKHCTCQWNSLCLWRFCNYFLCVQELSVLSSMCHHWWIAHWQPVRGSPGSSVSFLKLFLEWTQMSRELTLMWRFAFKICIGDYFWNRHLGTLKETENEKKEDIQVWCDCHQNWNRSHAGV